MRKAPGSEHGLEYALDNGAWTAYAGQPVAVGNGTHQLRYRATDNAGNVETAKALTLNVATCTTTVTGLHNGPLTANGVVCLTGATINGPISVRDGAVLIATGSSIRGPVFASAALRVTLVDDNVHGPVSVSGTTGGVTIIGTVVTGPVSLTDNKGTVVVSTNTINGPLFCTGNSPAPTDNGTANTVHGPAAGQCAGL